MAGLRLLRIAAVCLCATLVAGQTNYVDDYEFENAPPPPRSGPSRTFTRPAPSPSSSGPRPTPVAILKQIDRHNEDGSYTYGYEGGDGSFKIETKLVTGEVMGKYGYVDDTGKVRVVEYGANRYGFMPAGEGITVAPPTLVDETTKKGQKGVFVDDGSYYPEEEPLPAPRPAPRPAQRSRPAAPRPQPQPVYDDFPPPPPPPPQPAPAPRRQAPSSSGPVPPRPVIPGAAPVFSPAPVYEERPQHRSFAPPPQRAPQPQVVSRPPPPPQRFESIPQPAPQRHQHFAPPPQAPRTQHARTSGGILDQLERDYALPQGGSVATHDISFGSY